MISKRFAQLSTLYTIATCFAKLSVLLLYLRFFRIVTLTRHLIWSGITFTVLSSCAFLGIVITQAIRCMGLYALTNNFCLQTSKIVVIQASINVTLDFYIIAIPLQQVYQLKINSRKKLGVAAVFSVGFM